MRIIIGCVVIVLLFSCQLTEELSKVEEKLKLTESLLENKVPTGCLIYLDSFFGSQIETEVDKTKIFTESGNQENK